MSLATIRTSTSALLSSAPASAWQQAMVQPTLALQAPAPRVLAPQQALAHWVLQRHLQPRELHWSMVWASTPRSEQGCPRTGRKSIRAASCSFVRAVSVLEQVPQQVPRQVPQLGAWTTGPGQHLLLPHCSSTGPKQEACAHIPSQNVAGAVISRREHTAFSLWARADRPTPHSHSLDWGLGSMLLKCFQRASRGRVPPVLARAPAQE
jgi:hypothetical protein